MKMSVDVIIPVYRPDKKFDELLAGIIRQTLKPEQIIILNTESFPEYSNGFLIQHIKKILSIHKVEGKENISVRVVAVSKKNFDHGGTRHYGAFLSKSQFMVFMTQDAIPANEYLLEQLLKPFETERVAASYARQVAPPDSDVIEQYTRIFNYPVKSRIKTKEDIYRFGIKTYFCSNVCAAYRRNTYFELGGFKKHTIFNEDMIFGAAIIEAGYAIAYTAEAKVRHSHRYSWPQQFTRNFDLGVSHKEYSDIFSKVPAEGEGIKLVKETWNYLIDQKEYLEAADLIVQSGFKYLGYFFGKHYDVLPKQAVSLFSMNKSYWTKSRGDQDECC